MKQPQMSITLSLEWFSNALATLIPEHYSKASLIVADNTVSVLTFPYCEETICVKSTALTAGTGFKPVCIHLNDSIRDFIKKCNGIFEQITLEIIDKNMVLSLKSDTQALKYQSPVMLASNRDVVPSPEDIELVLIGDGLLRSCLLFSKNKIVKITTSPDQKNIKIECEQPKICTLFACANAPPSVCSFTCFSSSMDVLQLLSPGKAISIVFMSSGVLSVKNDSEKIYIAPMTCEKYCYKSKKKE